MPTALFVSPHLDDVAFSCGGTVALMATRGWRTILATVFTRSVSNPTGFALDCQLDKGLSPEVDYMALRREEDARFACRVGAEAVYLNYTEAPHRGYESAPALFAGVLEEDEIWRDLRVDLADLLRRYSPNLLFAPQGLGNHTDHLQVLRAVLEVKWRDDVLWYRDTPYAIRERTAEPSSLLPDEVVETSVDLTEHLDIKLDAVAAYETQLSFQFGGEEAMREALGSFARAEAERTGLSGAAETFLVRKPRDPTCLEAPRKRGIHDTFGLVKALNRET